MSGQFLFGALYTCLVFLADPVNNQTTSTAVDNPNNTTSDATSNTENATSTVDNNSEQQQQTEVVLLFVFLFITNCCFRNKSKQIHDDCV